MKIVIPLVPRTKKNSQQILYKNHKGRRVPFIATSKAYKAYQEEASWLVKCLPKPIDYKINVKALYYMDKDYDKIKSKIDLTNLHEALHDILVYCGVLEDDCSRIIVSTDGSRVLFDKNNPRTEVYIDKVDKENY